MMKLKHLLISASLVVFSGSLIAQEAPAADKKANKKEAIAEDLVLEKVQKTLEDSKLAQVNHLIKLLESFEPEEAVVFVNMMKKDLKTKGLTESLVREVFPELF